MVISGPPANLTVESGVVLSLEIKEGRATLRWVEGFGEDGIETGSRSFSASLLLLSNEAIEERRADLRDAELRGEAAQMKARQAKAESDRLERDRRDFDRIIAEYGPTGPPPVPTPSPTPKVPQRFLGELP